jgi:L-ascorbate metabolism protein UlaG (beta-lactamase superfamily)
MQLFSSSTVSMMVGRVWVAALLICSGLLAQSMSAIAAPPAPNPAPDRCLAMASLPDHAPDPGRSIVKRAKFEPAQLAGQLTPAEVRISFVGHSTFLIESAQGVRIATDYNDYFRPGIVPEIATMNRAHDSHYSSSPDPGIKHLLRGWSPDGAAAQHDVTLRDVRVRNIPTNTRDWQGGTNVYGNSVFIFEIAGLCIAHLGHLHHTLTVQQLGQLGQMDIVLIPVDGSYTLDLAGMIDVLRAIKAPLMIPMHYFSGYTLERFLTRVRDTFEIEQSALPSVVMSRANLPPIQKVLVLPGR